MSIIIIIIIMDDQYNIKINNPIPEYFHFL